MSKTNFILLLFVLPLSLLGQKKKYMSFTENWQIATTEEVTAYSCECYVNDADQFIGRFTCYHNQLGILVKDYNFLEDALHGEVKEYFLNGQLKLDAEYNKGLPINEWKEFDEEGMLVLHRTFDESSRITKDYFSESTPYDNAIAFSHKTEEPPIYTSKCIMLNIEDQKFECSQQAILEYLANPPIPPSYLKNLNFQGLNLECLLQFRINRKGIVDQVKIIASTGDEFLDELAEAHVLNMVPFESAKQYGNPIDYWVDAQIIFRF